MITNKQLLAIKEEYNNFINILNDTTNLVKFKNQDYLIFLNLDDSLDTLLITITDGLSLIWPKELNFEDFQEIRKKIGMEGDYHNFFTLLKDALTLKNGNFKIDINSKHEMMLTIYYKISKEATLTGVIDMGTPVQFKDDQLMFRQFIKKILLDLQVSKRNELSKSEKECVELKEKLKHSEMELAALRKLNPMNLPDIPIVSSLDTRKKKATTDLINPNMKRKKIMGAKFGSSQNDN